MIYAAKYHVDIVPEIEMPEVNWGMPTTTLKDTYSLDPAWGHDKKFEENNLFGVAGTLWSEYMMRCGISFSMEY